MLAPLRVLPGYLLLLLLPLRACPPARLPPLLLLLLSAGGRRPAVCSQTRLHARHHFGFLDDCRQLGRQYKPPHGGGRLLLALKCVPQTA